MTQSATFQPNWTTPPGATVLDVLLERDISVNQFANDIQKESEEVSRLLHGVEPLTADWAQLLADRLGASPNFWLRREELYRSDVHRLCEMAAARNDAQWVSALPIKEMVQFGWIRNGATKKETISNACAFLAAYTNDGLDKRYTHLFETTAYRTSAAFESNLSSEIVWLRQGEIAASAIDCQVWSEQKLQDSLGAIRSLTRSQDPDHFFPELTQLLAACGVALVVERAPKGCRASGAARFLTDKKALIQLSARYLADDQLWFTLFHEIGHLILHSKKDVFLEVDGVDDEATIDAEIEADKFAAETLFQKVGLGAVDDVELTKFAIARLARKADISPGLVVGRLQTMQRIPYKHFNFLKVRYAWHQ